MTIRSSAAAPRRYLRSAAACVMILSLAGCASTQSGIGQKESIGTGAGALIGGIAGSFLGKGSGRIVGVLAGAAIGGLIGNRIGSMLDEEDQKALRAQTGRALLSQPDDASIQWNSARTDATATVTPQNTRVERREMKVVRSTNVSPPDQIETIGALYQATSATAVHLSPSDSAATSASLDQGATVWAVGKVRDQPWILVAEKGKSIGYVRQASIEPARRATAATPQKPSHATQPTAAPAAKPKDEGAVEAVAFDLDAPAVREPVDLDALAPDETADIIVASVTCRDITTTTTARGETATATQTACRSPDGSWELN